MIKKQFAILAFALLILGYTVMTTGNNSQPEGYYLTIGERGIAEITYTAPGSSGGCVHADGSLFRKGEQVWLEGLDEKDNLEGVTVSALDKSGNVCWSKDFGGSSTVELGENGWEISYQEG